MTHKIRLHGPWQCTFPQSDAASQTIRMPCDLRDAIAQPPGGVIHLQRKFNRPTGLEAGQQVKLVLESVDGVESVLLNDMALTLAQHGDNGISAVLTTRLEDTNLITVCISLPSDGELPRGVSGEVRLEIEEDPS